MDTNLAVTTAERKDRLIALRKRKQAAEQGNGANGSGPYVFVTRPIRLLLSAVLRAYCFRSQITLCVQAAQLRS